MSRTIQVFEHETLTLHEDQWGQRLTQDELSRLYEFNDKYENSYFTGIRNGIKLGSYVGVIQIGGLTLEILPKVDKRKEQSIAEHETATNTWRNALLRMLAFCRYIKIDSVSTAFLERRHHSILDLYFELFLDEVEKLLRLGLIKRYRIAQGNLPVLKGRWNFNKNIQQNLIHPERFYTHHCTYDQDNLINQILLRALDILHEITNNSNIRDRVARLRLDLPKIKHLAVQAYHFSQIVDNRKTIQYTEALKIARMIILNYSPDVKGGREDMLALLFDMNKLWEEYIFRILLKNKGDGVEVSFQNSKAFWETKTIRPDLVITKESKTFVIDTKWKSISSTKPDDNDLKQIFAYNLYWKSYHGILLYPSAASSKSKKGIYHQGLDKEHGCTLAFVDVLDNQGRLNNDCHSQIFRMLD